ncbi:hypothetical protein SLA2020_413930 [Shorea laevis]
MEVQNISLLSKLGWNLLNSPDSLLVKILSSKYLFGASFLTASCPASASWLWKGILKCRHIVLRGACWLVSSGREIDIWNSPWIPSIDGFKPSPNPSLPSLPNLKVSDLISFPIRGWNIPLLHFLFDPHLQKQFSLSISLWFPLWTVGIGLPQARVDSLSNLPMRLPPLLLFLFLPLFLRQTGTVFGV